MNPEPSGRHPLKVSHGQFWLADFETQFTDPGAYRTTNGYLCSQIPSGTVALTGTRYGWVDLQWACLPTEPDLHLNAWDEVVEVSMEFDEGEAIVGSPEVGDTYALPALTDGAGWYRVRFHASGRDAADVAPEFTWPPIESHLLQIWPAPRRPDDVHKITDARGKTTRVTHT